MCDDFTGNNVEAAATLMMGAGRFLYKQKPTHMRLRNSLEVRLPNLVTPLRDSLM